MDLGVGEPSSTKLHASITRHCVCVCARTRVQRERAPSVLRTRPPSSALYSRMNEEHSSSRRLADAKSLVHPLQARAGAVTETRAPWQRSTDPIITPHSSLVHSLAIERKSEEAWTERMCSSLTHNQELNKVLKLLFRCQTATQSSSNLPSAEPHEIQTLPSFL